MWRVNVSPIYFRLDNITPPYCTQPSQLMGDLTCDGPLYTESAIIPLGDEGAIFAATAILLLGSPGVIVYFKHVPLGPAQNNAALDATDLATLRIPTAYRLHDEGSDQEEPASKRVMYEYNDAGDMCIPHGHGPRPYPDNYQTIAPIVNFDGIDGVTLLAASPTLHEDRDFGCVSHSETLICALGGRTPIDSLDHTYVDELGKREHYIIRKETIEVGRGMPDMHSVCAMRMAIINPTNDNPYTWDGNTDSVDGMESIVSACVTLDSGVTHVRAIVATRRPADGEAELPGVVHLTLVSVGLDEASKFWYSDAKVGESMGLSLYPCKTTHSICLNTPGSYARREDIHKASFQWDADSVTWVRPFSTGVLQYTASYASTDCGDIVAKFRRGGLLGPELLNAGMSEWALCCPSTNQFSRTIIASSGNETHASELFFEDCEYRDCENHDWPAMHGFVAQRNQVMSGAMFRFSQIELTRNRRLFGTHTVIMGIGDDGIGPTAQAAVAEFYLQGTRYPKVRRANLLFYSGSSAIGEELGECHVYHNADGKTYLYSTARKTVYVLNV